jgi:RNA polymerase sigma-70 factor (ECF subfamily)
VDPDPTDEARLRRLYADHGSFLLAYATRLGGGDRQRAEDAVQETLLRVWRQPPRGPIRPEGERAWLTTVIRNVVIDAYRARRVRPREVGGDALDGLGEPGDNDIERALESWTVVEALRCLSPDHRAVLIETFFRGRSVAEAAETLGVPPGTVKSRSYYALRSLRRTLLEGGSDEPSGSRLHRR